MAYFGLTNSSSQANFAYALILLTLSGAALADEHWTEEVVVADGPTIQVSRSVEYACRGTVLSTILDKYPCLFRLDFEHPKLPLTVRWRGIRYINPIAVQVIRDVPYLAIYSGAGYSPMHDKPQSFGCPEVPFSFLKYDLKSGDWSPVAPMEVPESLLDPNLTADYYLYRPKGKLSKEIVAEIVKSQSRNGYLQTKIPRNADEWSYKLKKSFLTSRVTNDCRPPLEKVVDAIFPMKEDGKNLDLELIKTKIVDYEVVEDKYFDPPLMIPDVERPALWFNKETAEKCNSYFVKPDQHDQRLTMFQGFVADSRGRKFTGNGLNNLYCGNDFNYGINYLDNEFFVLAKYTKSGDVLRYLKIPKPKKMMGTVVRQSKIENGYLHFVLSETTWKEGFRGVIFTRWLTVRVKDE